MELNVLTTNIKSSRSINPSNNGYVGAPFSFSHGDNETVFKERTHSSRTPDTEAVCLLREGLMPERVTPSTSRTSSIIHRVSMHPFRGGTRGIILNRNGTMGSVRGSTISSWPESLFRSWAAFRSLSCSCVHCLR